MADYNFDFADPLTGSEDTSGEQASAKRKFSESAAAPLVEREVNALFLQYVIWSVANAIWGVDDVLPIKGPPSFALEAEDPDHFKDERMLWDAVEAKRAFEMQHLAFLKTKIAAHPEFTPTLGEAPTEMQKALHNIYHLSRYIKAAFVAAVTEEDIHDHTFVYTWSFLTEATYAKLPIERWAAAPEYCSFVYRVGRLFLTWKTLATQLQ